MEAERLSQGVQQQESQFGTGRLPYRVIQRLT